MSPQNTIAITRNFHLSTMLIPSGQCIEAAVCEGAAAWGGLGIYHEGTDVELVSEEEVGVNKLGSWQCAQGVFRKLGLTRLKPLIFPPHDRRLHKSLISPVPTPLWLITIKFFISWAIYNSKVPVKCWMDINCSFILYFSC